MITITRKVVKLLRSVFRKAHDNHSRNQGTVFIRVDDGQLRVQLQNGNVAVEYAAGDSDGKGSIALPLTALADLEGIKDDPVQFQSNDKGVRAEWNDHGVALSRQYTKCRIEPLLELASNMAPFGDGCRLEELVDVVESTANDAIKFVMDSVQLRGKGGEAVGTDGHQLLIKRGFDFPWKDDVLIASSRLVGCRQLNEEDVSIGRTKKHVVFKTGPWTVWLAIKEGRFPAFEKVIPSAPVKSRLILNDDDANFLIDAIPRLPVNDQRETAVTVHANGRVNIFAANEDGPPTELVLEKSRVDGSEIKFVTSRQHLQRAMELGAREIQVRDAKTPFVAQTKRHTYVWMPLVDQAAVPTTPTNNTAKPPAIKDGSASSTNERSATIMNRTTAASVNGDETNNAEDQVIDPIEEGEAIKVQLREITGRVSNLVAAIKRQRKQAQIVRSTLASLKQLQEVA